MGTDPPVAGSVDPTPPAAPPTTNGAHALIRTLVASGVQVCFANPGTSEMHFVAALDDVPEMRGVLTLFEGVASGAADGYARLAGRPAATLLHLGPGLGNAIANLHNARRARSPVVNVVGDHATTHRFDTFLASDIPTLARNVSRWVRTCEAPERVGTDTADAVAAALGPPGEVATLILPADVSWGGPAEPAPAPPPAPPRPVDPDAVTRAAAALRDGTPAALLVGGSVTADLDALRSAGRIAAATGAKLLAETFPARLERGAGIPAPERLGYLGEFVLAQLVGIGRLVLVEAQRPVSFFAYPGRPSVLVPDGCEVVVLATPGEDGPGALAALAAELGATTATPAVPGAQRPDRPTGALTGETVAAALGALLPEDAVVVDEAATAGLWAPGATAGAPPHTWCSITGGAIGYGIPAALGAAIGAEGRPVINLEADGSACYTIQALWSCAREGVDVTTVILNNRSYAILNMELDRVGAAGGGPAARRMLDLSHPDLDFTRLAAGFGVPAVRATDAEGFTDALERAMREPGPHLVEAVLATG